MAMLVMSSCVRTPRPQRRTDVQQNGRNVSMCTVWLIRLRESTWRVCRRLMRTTTTTTDRFPPIRISGEVSPRRFVNTSTMITAIRSWASNYAEVTRSTVRVLPLIGTMLGSICRWEILISWPVISISMPISFKRCAMLVRCPSMMSSTT